MNKIPKFFRKRKTETGQEIQSPTKDILTPAELDKLKNKIRQEITAAEIRIAYILKRQHRSKPGDREEIEERETDIKHLRTKYQELVDPDITVYFAKKKQAEPRTIETLIAAESISTAEPLIAAESLTAAEPLATEPIDQAPPVRPRRIKENRVSDLFDYREEDDETRAAPFQSEEVTSECIGCKALVTYTVNTQSEHCRRCKAEIQPKQDSDVDQLQQHLTDLLLTDKTEKVDVTEQRSPLQNFLEEEDDEFEYFGDEQDQVPNQQEEQDNHEKIYGSINDQQEEQNNNEHIYDSVDDGTTTDDQSDDENQEGRPIFFRNYYDPIDVIDNQVQPYIPQNFFADEMALT